MLPLVLHCCVILFLFDFLHIFYLQPRYKIWPYCYAKKTDVKTKFSSYFCTFGNYAFCNLQDWKEDKKATFWVFCSYWNLKHYRVMTIFLSLYYNNISGNCIHQNAEFKRITPTPWRIHIYNKSLIVQIVRLSVPTIHNHPHRTITFYSNGILLKWIYEWIQCNCLFKNYLEVQEN